MNYVKNNETHIRTFCPLIRPRNGVTALSTSLTIFADLNRQTIFISLNYTYNLVDMNTSKMDGVDQSKVTLFYIFSKNPFSDNPGQNTLGHLKKLFF